MAKGSVEGPASGPVLACFLGRQRIGKSVTAWALKAISPETLPVQVWDFDPAALQEDGRTLSWLLPSAMKPTKPDDQSRIEWLRERTDEMIGAVLDGKPFNVFCDFGGIEEMLKRFSGKFEFVTALEEFGIRVVAIHVVGPEVADLRFLHQVESTGAFKPKLAALVLNEGMVHEDQDPEAAFSGVLSSPVVSEFRKRGGVIGTMPVLFQMPKIVKLREEKGPAPLRDFTIAATGLGHLESRLVRIWLDEKVPKLRERLGVCIP
jgi:hypothetical protein